MLDEKQTAEAVEAKTGAKVTNERLDEVIVGVDYFQPEGTTLTLCILTLRNGFTCVGESACVDPANFDSDIGEAIAFRNARDKIWLLEGYVLAERRYLSERPSLEATEGKL